MNVREDYKAGKLKIRSKTGTEGKEMLHNTLALKQLIP